MTHPPRTLAAHSSTLEVHKSKYASSLRHHTRPPFVHSTTYEAFPFQLASWSEDDIVRIPHHLFLLHPEARRMQDEIVALKSRVATLEQTNAQLVASTAQLSALVASKPSAGPNASSSTSTSAQTYAQVLSYQQDDGKILINGEDLSCIPQRRPLEELADEETMCWTQAHAQRLHANQQYGKQEITREADGQVIESDVLEVIEKEVRFACAALDQLKMPEWLKGKTRTYELYTTYFLPDVLRICVRLERKLPQLSYCTLHYKALKWVQKRLKAQVETANNAKRSYAKTQQSDGRASKKQRRAESPAASRPAARPMTAASAATTTKKGKGKARAREPVPQRQADTDSSSDPMSDQDEGRDAFAPFFSSYGSMCFMDEHRRRNLNKRASFPGADEAHDRGACIQAQAHPRFVSGASSDGTASTASALRQLFEHQLARSCPVLAKRRPHIAHLLLAPLRRSSSLLSLSHEPHGPSMEAKDKETANRGPAVNESADTGTATAASTLASLRQSDANSLAPPTLSSLRILLKTRYSGLQVKDKVASALERLETAEPNHQDEDKSGPSFGHDELGSCVYHSPLQKRKTYGSIRNACRLLAALLRIWAVAKEDCLKLGSKFEPTVKASLETITGYIEQAFTDAPLSSAPPSGPSNTEVIELESDNDGQEQSQALGLSQAAAPLSETQSQAQETQILTTATTTPAGRKTGSQKQKATIARSRGAMELKRDIVTDAILKKLKKVSLVRILALSKKRHEPTASKEVLLAAVRRGIDDGSVKITAVQFKELFVGLDNITDADKMAGSRAQVDRALINTCTAVQTAAKVGREEHFRRSALGQLHDIQSHRRAYTSHFAQTTISFPVLSTTTARRRRLLLATSPPTTTSKRERTEARCGLHDREAERQGEIPRVPSPFPLGFYDSASSTLQRISTLSHAPSSSKLMPPWFPSSFASL
ncbi:hypothetical protein V8E36_006974 [Tilletia maclaganii]